MQNFNTDQCTESRNVTDQGDSVEDLHLSDIDAAWVSKKAVGTSAAGWQSTDTTRVKRSVADTMKHLHVVNVVHEQTALQAHDQPLSATD